MTDRLVSIISVNFNQPEVTAAMLASLSCYTGNPEVIIIDNGSKEDPGEFLKSSYPDIIYIRSDENLGFAGGNNLGIKKANGKYLLFINNDTEVTPGLIECMVEYLENNLLVGGISPKIHYYDHHNTFQFAGFTKVNILTGRNATIGEMEKDNRQYDECRPIPYLHGAAMMVRAEVISKAGLMPEEFFLYYEELDWSESIRHAGYALHYVPCGIIHHKESVSTGKNSPLKTYFLNRNRILFMKRNQPRIPRLIFMLFFTFVSLPVNLARFLIQGQGENARKVLEAYVWNYSKTGRKIGKYKY